MNIYSFMTCRFEIFYLICNHLQLEAPQAMADINSVIFLLESMIKRGHFRDLYPTIAFSL